MTTRKRIAPGVKDTCPTIVPALKKILSEARRCDETAAYFENLDDYGSIDLARAYGRRCLENRSGAEALRAIARDIVADYRT